MKILRLYPQLPPIKGGMEKHIYELSKYQVNHNNHIVNMYNSGEEINANSQKVFSFFELQRIQKTTIEITVYYICVVLKLFLKKERFDVIHIHGDWSSLLFYKLIKKLTSAKIVVFSLHGQLSCSFTHQKLLPRLVLNIDLIFSTGYDTANELEKLSGKKVVIQPSGINNIFFQEFDKNFENEIFTIVTVANLFPKKNIELVLDIAKEMKECRFIVVGGGTHRKILEDKIKNENISNVELIGFKSSKEVRDYYQYSDCYLLTSFAEGTPTSALEAMACGLPIVSSNAGGLSNIVQEHENGFVIDDFNKNKYIEKIKLLQSDVYLKKKIFEKNILLAQKYKWENVAGNITAKMEEKLNEKN
jgi:glycosyltransferase involved in cell wall biosynthesis